MFVIREIKKTDIPQMQKLAKGSFFEAYKTEFELPLLKDYIKTAFSLERLQEEVLDRNNHFIVSLQKNKMVGYVKLRLGKTPECLGKIKVIEIERIYTDSTMKRQGIGSGLIESAKEKAKTLNFEGVWLGVFQNNLRAVEFYKKQGFRIKGETIFMMGNEPQNDFIMVAKN